jgi:tetratricopeptide (TPR) repeat protein
MFGIAGCGPTRASLEKQYVEARLQFLQGFTEQPLQRAEAGLLASTRYPDLNWKFRVLAAEANARKGRVDRALDLLQPEPPTNVPAEIFWRRRLDQASALCQLRKNAAAEEHLIQAASLAGDQHDKVTELTYVRGRCAVYNEKWNDAERYLLSIAGPEATADPFLKVYILANLGWAVRMQLNYEEALDWNIKALAAARAAGATPLEQNTLGNIGFFYVELRDFPNAMSNIAAAEKLAEQLKDSASEQRMLIDLGVVQQAQGQSGLAEVSFNRALDISTKLGNRDVAARALLDLTGIKIYQQKLDLAEK